MVTRQITRKFKVLTFDVTNTIIKVKGSPSHQYVAAARAHGIEVSLSDIQKAYRPVWVEKKKLHPCYGIKQGISTQDWWADFVAKVFIEAGYNGDRKKLEGVSDTLFVAFHAANNWEVLPHSHSVLTKLKEEGYKLAVVSNFDERLERTLEKYHLRDYFDLLVTPVLARQEKPDPGIFHYALEKLSMKPEDAAHIGDDIVNDYFCAKNAGMEAYLLDAHEKYRDLDMKEIEDKNILSELRDLKSVLGLN